MPRHSVPEMENRPAVITPSGDWNLMLSGNGVGLPLTAMRGHIIEWRHLIVDERIRRGVAMPADGRSSLRSRHMPCG